MTDSDFDLTKLTAEELRDLERILTKALRAPRATAKGIEAAAGNNQHSETVQ